MVLIQNACGQLSQNAGALDHSHLKPSVKIPTRSLIDNWLL